MKKINNILAIGVAVFLLSSCMTHKEYEQKTEIEGLLYGAGVDTSSSSIAETSWQDFFTDPMLKELIETALTANTDVQSAEIAVKQAELSLRTSKLAFYPSLYFNPSGTLSSFDNSPVSKAYNLPLQLDWQIDAFGGMKNRKRNAAAILEQTKYQEEAMRANVISTVAQLYYRLLIYDRQLTILLDTEKLWASSLDVQKALMENGKAYSTAVNQMEASYLNVKTQIVDIRKAIHSSELSLCRILCQEPQHIKRNVWGQYAIPKRIGTGVPSLLLTYRSDVKVAERAMAAAHYNIMAAKADFFPSISLGGSIGWTNNAGAIADPGKLLWNALASLTQPIFARGKLKAAAESASLAMDDVRKKYYQTVINAGNEVNEAIADCRAAQEKDELYKRQVAVLKDAFDGTHELMNNGKANYLEVLTAQEALLQAQLAEAMNLYDGYISSITLYIALGGATK